MIRNFFKRSRERPAPPEGYAVFTRKFDLQAAGDELTRGLAPIRRKHWEQQTETYRESTAKERTACNLALIKATDELKASLHFEASCHVVTLLVDHSGSMKGQRAIIACMIMEAIAQFLSRAGVTYEILGFTTREWKGGLSRYEWIKSRRPHYPGRLNDLLHIVYRDTSNSNTDVPYAVHHILRDELLKENIDGEAIEWAIARLKALEHPRKTMIVVSDGAPVDESTLSANNNDYLWKHLKSVIQQAQTENGIQMAGIGIDYDVASLYAHNIKVESLDQLSLSLPRFLRHLLSKDAQV